MYRKLFINLFIISLISLSFVRADDEISSTEEIILTPGPITGEYKNKDLDASYDESSSVMISCSGTSCTTSNGSDGISINKGNVTISTAGTYVLQGDLQGQVYISATEDDFVHLILNNMSITSNNGPALFEVECDKLVITMVGENSLTDSTNYTVDEDEEPDGCLFAKSDLSFNGEGTLTVTGNYSEGIRCKKDLKLVSGTINVFSKEKGIKAKNSVSIKEAVVNVESGDTAIKACKDTDPEKGFVVIDGGRIVVKSGKDGIHAETHLTINGGYIDVSESEEGLEGQMIDIQGGEIHINANDDGINASKIGATNDEFGPGGMGGPRRMNESTETMNPESGNMGNSPSQQPDATLLPNNPSEQIENTVIDNNEEGTTQSTTISSDSFETSTTIPSTTIATKTIPSNINEINSGNGQNNQGISTKNVIPIINSNNNNNNNNNNSFGQNNNSFGRNNNSFGQQNNNNNNNNPFGQNSNNNNNNNPFGQNNNNNNNNNPFGQNNNSFVQNNNSFAQQNKNNNNNNPFGQNNNNINNNNSFGQNNNNNNNNNNPFGQNNNNNNNNNPFGQNNNNNNNSNPFGQNNNNNPFGQNNNAFGQNNNSFAQQNKNNNNNNPFGQNNNSFGQQNNNNNNNNPFGQNNNSFGQNNNSFGQNDNFIGQQPNKITTTKTIPNVIPTGNAVRVSNTNTQKSNPGEKINQSIKQLINPSIQQPQHQGNNYNSNNKINSNKGRITKTVYKTVTATRKNIIPTLPITGGKVYVKIDGGDVDGIDSNGSLYIGGESEVYVSNGSGDIYGNMASLDAEGSNVIDNGATVIVTASGMNNGGMGGGPARQSQGGPNNNQMNKEDQTNQTNQTSQNNQFNPNEIPEIPNNSTQPPQFEGFKQNFNQTEFGEFGAPMDGAMRSHGGMGGGPGGQGGPGGMESGSIKQANIQMTVNLQEAGSEITVTDSEGNIIISHQPETSYSKILISSPKLVEGATYTVVAGTETQTATASVDSS
ncbi:hypothetical protein U3516DRAFT_856198 [Neocallimastix sp. 'constans']